MERVRDALREAGLGYQLSEQFEWGRHPETMAAVPPFVDEQGVVHIPRQPTIRLIEGGVEQWAHTLEACLELVEGLRAELHELQ